MSERRTAEIEEVEEGYRLRETGVPAGSSLIGWYATELQAREARRNWEREANREGAIDESPEKLKKQLIEARSLIQEMKAVDYDSDHPHCAYGALGNRIDTFLKATERLK